LDINETAQGARPNLLYSILSSASLLLAIGYVVLSFRQTFLKKKGKKGDATFLLGRYDPGSSWHAAIIACRDE